MFQTNHSLQPLKILLVADRMESGGAETHIACLARSLKALGHTPVLLSLGGTMADLLREEGIHVLSLPKHFPRSLFFLWKTIKAEKPDLVHTHTRRGLFFASLPHPSGRGIPVLFTAHAAFSPSLPKRLSVRFPPRIIAVSEDIARHLTNAFGVPRPHITVIPNGIDTSFFSPGLCPPHPPRILFVSRMDKDCSLGAFLLCDLAPRLAAEYPGLTIRLVGGGNAYGEVRARAGSSSVVTLTGQVTDLREEYRNADIFVGVSRAALEAMACGKPVILCGNEGFGGILTPEVLYDAERTNYTARGSVKPTEERLGAALLSLLPDKPLRASLGAFGREVILSRHSLTRVTQETVILYRQILSEGKEKRVKPPPHTL